MIRPLTKAYIDDLNEIHSSETWGNEKYKFYFMNGYNGIFKEIKDTWGGHNFVILGSEKEIIGCVGYSIDQTIYSAHALAAICYSEEPKDVLTFGKDLYTILKNVFEKYNFNKLNFCVVIGNPVEEQYDQICKKMNGRIVGIKKNDVRLQDGKLYDIKLYEILNPKAVA